MKKLLSFIVFMILSKTAIAQEEFFHFVLSSGPGSGSDISIEAYSQCFKKQNIRTVKEFKPGGDGIIAINTLRQHQNKNNYTYILVGNFGLNMLGRFPNIDLLEDIHPITYLNQPHLALVANKEKISSINDLVSQSRIRPLNIGSSSVSGTYFANELLKDLNIPFQVINYKNSASALNDLLQGSIDASVDTFVGTKQLVDANRLQILTSTFDRNLAKTYGHENLERYSPNLARKPFGIILSVSPNTSDATKNLIVDAVNKCHRDTELLQRLSELGTTPVLNVSTQQLRGIIQSIIKK